MDRGWKTTGDLTRSNGEIKASKIIKRNIKFDTKVRVILIPTRQEYCDIGLGEVLWWSNSDYGTFKESAGNELRTMLSLYGMDAKAAIAQLYQPDLYQKRLGVSPTDTDICTNSLTLICVDQSPTISQAKSSTADLQNLEAKRNGLIPPNEKISEKDTSTTNTSDAVVENHSKHPRRKGSKSDPNNPNTRKHPKQYRANNSHSVALMCT